MTKIGKEKNMSGSREIVLQVKEDGKKLDELKLPMKYVKGDLIGLNIVNLRLDELAKDAHRKLKATQSLLKFLKKHS